MKRHKCTSAKAKNNKAQYVTYTQPMWRRTLCYVLSLLLTFSQNPAFAQIVANSQAPVNQQATVLLTANGLPQVNIQTPNAAGVSLNSFSQFDVTHNGAILNNSRTNIQTQTAGWIQGNPWLATGSASIIVNQVQSVNPSSLQGYIEVAGQRAEVVIANPAGINVNGGGFINANQVVLTTGTPMMNNGYLTGYLVRGGNIAINGNGLDTSSADYTSILAGAVQANAGIWAKQLTVVTGNNQISADQSVVTPVASAGFMPAVAIDVAQLGGMYAGKIFLMATQAGVGVTNAGVIGASAGDVVLQANGWLTNSGSIQATGNVQAAATGTMDNSGTVYSGGNTSVTSQAGISNRGLIAAQGNTSVQTTGASAKISSAVNAVFAAGLNADGSLAGSGDLHITSFDVATLNGQSAAGGNALLSATALDVSGARISAQNIGLTATVGDVTATGSNVGTTGTFTVVTPTTLRTDAARISANQLSVAAHDMSNVGGGIALIGTGDTNFNLPGNLDNTGGSIAVNSQNFNLSATTLTNTNGSILHAGTGELAINAATLNDSSGRIISNGALNVNAGSVEHDNASTSAVQIYLNLASLSNRGGTFSQSGDGQAVVSVSQGMDNTGGTLASNGSLVLTSATLGNNQGSITAGQDVAVAVGGNLDNTGGILAASQNLTLAVGNNLNNASGIVQATNGNASVQAAVLTNGGMISAGKNLTTQADSVVNSGTLYAAGLQNLNVSGTVTNGGVIAAQGDTTVVAASLASAGGSLLAAGIQPNRGLADGSNLSITTTQMLAANGQNQSTGNISLSGGMVDVSAAQMSGANISINASQGNVSTAQANVSTAGTLSVVANTSSGQTLDNTQGTLSANHLLLNVANLNNTAGTLVQTGSDDLTISLSGPSGALDNTNGRIASNSQNLSLSANTLTNTGGLIQHAGTGTLTLASATFNDQSGRITTNGAVNIATDSFNHDSAATTANQITVVAGSLSNRSGSFIQSGNKAATFSVTGSVDNTGGQLLGNGDIGITALALTNQNGSVGGSGNVTLSTTGAVDNSNKGMIAAGGNVNLKADSLDNNQGGINAQGTLSATVSQAASNIQGTLSSNGASDLAAASVDNSSGTIESIKAGLSIRTTGTTTNDSGLIFAAGDVSLNNSGLSNSIANGATLGGMISAANLALNSQGRSVNNAGGTLAASQSATLTTGALDNTGGLIQATGALSINTQGQTLTNTRAASYSTGQGGITSQSTLTLNTGDLDNTTGYIGTAGGITAANANVINTSGSIVSNGDLGITAQSIANQNGTIGTSGNAILAVAGIVDNSNRGLITVGNNFHLNANNLNNNQGRINAAGTLSSDTTQDISNVQGTLAANGALNLTASSVNNSSGVIASVIAGVGIATSGVTTNDSGQILAAGDINLGNSGLSNSIAAGANNGGAIRSANLAIDSRAQGVNNAGGTLVAGKGATLVTGALDNSGGLIQATDALLINTQGQTLTNTNAAGYSAGLGGITGQSTLTLQTGDLNNTAGYIGAVGNITAASGNIINSNNGQIAGQAAISATGTGLANAGGRIQAGGDIGVNVGGGSIVNIAGLISSVGAVSLAAAGLANDNTQGGNQGVAGNNVYITVNSLSNASGTLVALNNLTVTGSGTINNSNGLMSAGNVLTLQDTAAIKTLAIANTSGTMIAQNNLAIDTASLGGDGQLLSKGDLGITLTSNFSNSGTVTANHNATITTTGDITNSGTLQAGNVILLTANNLTNTSGGVITATTTNLTAAGTLTNRGLIDGQTTLINAGTLDNIGTGRIYGDQLSINAGTLNNTYENGMGATIAARAGLDLGTGTLNNSADPNSNARALIYSVGNATIGGSLDVNGHAAGMATAINNTGATIQAQGALTLDALQITNSNANFRAQLTPVTGPALTDYATSQGYISSKDVGWIACSSVDWYGNCLTHRIVPATNPYGAARYQVYYNSPTAYTPATAYGQAGISYGITDPIWAAFGITPPTQNVSAHPVGSCCDSYGNFFPPTQAQINAWMIAVQPWINLQNALNTMVASVNASPSVNETNTAGVISDVYRTYTQTSNTASVISSIPGQILAGGDMTLNATQALTNDKSQIIAGGALSATGQAVNNIAATLTGTIQASGTVYSWGVTGYTGHGWFYSPTPNYGWLTSPYSVSQPDTQTLAVSQVLANQNSPAPQKIAAIISSSGVGTNVSGFTGNSPTVANPTSNTVVTSVNAPGTSSTTRNGASAGPTILASAGRVTGIIVQPANAQSVAQTGAISLRQATSTQQKGGTALIKTAPVNLDLSHTSLYQVITSPASEFLVETDPQFTNNLQWTSSDYMLKALGDNPAAIEKRLGDGFYEQQLVNAQVSNLTGFYYLANYTSTDQEYQALMNNGVTVAKGMNLRVGVALTPAQVAQLTSDIVWLVSETVTLPDGSTTQVLVPQVYVAVQPGDINGSGTLLSGSNVNIKLTGDATNSGTIAGRNILNLTAQNVQNIGGTISANNAAVSANQDLNNIGGQIRAADGLNVYAGRDINVTTTTVSGNGAAGAGQYSNTQVARVAGLYVTGANGVLNVSAGRDLNLTAARLSNSGGTTTLAAGRDINLNTVTTADQSNVIWDPQNYARFGFTQETGTQINTQGAATLLAGNNINARAAGIQALGPLTMQAANDINVTAGVSTYNLATASYASGHGGLFGGGNSMTLTRTVDLSNSVASNLGGSSVVMASGGNLAITGSNVAGLQGIDLTAGGNLSLNAAANTRSASSEVKQSSAGFLSSNSAQTSDSLNQTTAQSTQLTGGAINLHSGGDIILQAAQISGTSMTAGAGLANGQVVNPNAQIVFEGVKESLSTSHTESSTGLLWQSKSGQGGTNESLKLTQINLSSPSVNPATPNQSSGNAQTVASSTPSPVLNASGGLIVTAVSLGNAGATPNGATTSGAGNAPKTATLDLQAQAQTLAQQPGLGYLADLSKRNDVTWQKVTLAKDNWNYSQAGLTPAGAALVAIAVTCVTAGAASGAAGAMTGTAAGTTTAASAALAVGMTTLASQAAVSLINNKGDIGQTLNDLGQSQNIKALVTAMVTAGALQGLNDTLGIQNINAANSTFTQQLQKNLIDNAASATINTAINGGSLEANLESGLKTAFIDTGAAQGANKIGDLYADKTLNDFTHILAHAIAGCAAGAARSGDCSSGALGAAVGELSAQLYGGARLNSSNLDIPALQTDTVNFARMMAGIAVALTGGDANAINLAANAGGNAAQNNYLSHDLTLARLTELAAATDQQQRDAINKKYQAISDKNNLDATTNVLADASSGGAPVTSAALEQEKAKLTAMVTGPTQCNADPACVVSVNSSVSQIDSILSTPGDLQSFLGVVPAIQSAILPLGVAADWLGLGSAANSGISTITNVRAISAEEANAPFVAKGWSPPYDTGSQVRTFTTTSEIQFVRVSTIDNPQGAFLVRADEISGMTPEQIQQYLALPKVPTQIADVTVPAGTNMQVGRVAAQPTFGAASNGGTQYQLLNPIPSSSFGTPRLIK